MIMIAQTKPVLYILADMQIRDPTADHERVGFPPVPGSALITVCIQRVNTEPSECTEATRRPIMSRSFLPPVYTVKAIQGL